MTIRYTTASCNLGRMLIARTDAGICAIGLADTDAELVERLHEVRSSEELTHDNAAVAEWCAAVIAYLNGGPLPKLPMDATGTEFQHRVWSELQRIPSGQTRSYSEVAAALGKPLAVRAVARACATNPVCLLVPCHRVIGSDGGLRGYRWGVERKQILLGREAQPTADTRTALCCASWLTEFNSTHLAPRDEKHPAERDEYLNYPGARGS